MALAATIIWEFNASAVATSNTAGGGFNPNATFGYTDLTTDTNTANTSAPIVGSASYNFIARDVGHWLFVKSGTSLIPGWYLIASVSSNKATLSAGIGAAILLPTFVSGTAVPTSGNYATNTTAGIATVATTTSGTFAIDYSQSIAVGIALTDLVIGADTTTAATVTANGCDKIMLGNVIHINSGTGFTQGWYEITAVNNISLVFTFDRSLGTTASTGGNGKIGGALSLNSTLDDDIFEAMTAGNYAFMKNGSFTLGEAVSISLAGTALLNLNLEGYATMRGDAPTGSTRPTIAGGTAAFTFGSFWNGKNLIFTTTAAGGMTCGVNGKLINCKSTNSSTTAARVGFTCSSPSYIVRCEGISYRGYGLTLSNSRAFVIDSYFHDCDSGIFSNSSGSATTPQVVTNCLIESCVTNAILINGGIISQVVIEGCTLFGSTNTTGTGVNWATSSIGGLMRNCIITGFVTGITHADAQSSNLDSYNDYFNNDTDVTNWIKGATSIALTPSFTNVSQVTGATATTTSGNHLVQSGATFVTSGVTAGRDFVYILTGAGVTPGIYGIASVDSETQITADITLTANATADKSFQITTGRNFAVGTNLRAAGFPGAFPGGYTTGYTDIGAFQRQEPGAKRYVFG